MHPVFFSAKAIFVANVDLPTPPFALEIAMVNFVPLIGFFVSVFVLILGSISLGFALFNVVGGFLVTDRMLAMFSRKTSRK